MTHIWFGRLTRAAVVVIALFAAGSRSVHASPGGTPGASCLVAFPGESVGQSEEDEDAVALKGTLAVEVTSGDVFSGTGFHDVDFTLRLHHRSRQQNFFRIHLFTPIGGLSDEQVVCRLLNPNDPAGGGDNVPVAFVQQILAAFGLPLNLRLVITSQSITNTDLSQAFLIPDTEHAASLADLKIYAVQP
jgi:hypothetical protein